MSSSHIVWWLDGPKNTLFNLCAQLTFSMVEVDLTVDSRLIDDRIELTDR